MVYSWFVFSCFTTYKITNIFLFCGIQSSQTGDFPIPITKYASVLWLNPILNFNCSKKWSNFAFDRFVAVFSDCKRDDNYYNHYAIISGMKSRELYKVDLKTGDSSIMELVLIWMFYLHRWIIIAQQARDFFTCAGKAKQYHIQAMLGGNLESERLPNVNIEIDHL